MPFLTLEDPRAKIKGSRDPLGLVPLWYVPARRLVGNLTTATGSLRGFTHTLLGRWYGERLLREERIEEADALGVFLRMEQIGAYVQVVAHGEDRDVRGIERVQRNAREGAGQVPIGVDAKSTILSDQKVYGLWGLYSVATRVSGLLLDGPIGMTEPAREFVEGCYGRRLRALDDKLLGLIQKGGLLPVRRNHTLFAELADILPKHPTEEESAWFGEWIRDGVHVRSLPPRRQQHVVELLRRFTDLGTEVDRGQLERMRDHAAREDGPLAEDLQRVLDLESLLVPADLAFQYLQSQRGRTVAEVAHTLRDRWGSSVPHLDAIRVRRLIPLLFEGDVGELGATIDRAASAFAAADYEAAVLAVLDWNELVMRARGGAAWVSLDERGRIDVHYAGIERQLPDGDGLASAWHNSYFLDSLKRICVQLEPRP